MIPHFHAPFGRDSRCGCISWSPSGFLEPIEIPGRISVSRSGFLVVSYDYFLSELTSAIVAARPVSSIAFIKLSVDFGARTLPDKIDSKDRSRP